jgi:broad specificity phosphatase PhoE
MAERVSHLSFDALLASPYQRAKETADAIGKITGKAPEFVELFTERVKPTSINGKVGEEILFILPNATEPAKAHDALDTWHCSDALLLRHWQRKYQ